MASAEEVLREHLAELEKCRRCPNMQSAPVFGKPVISKVMLVGQAPGIREPGANQLFTWTAGRTLFRWVEAACGVEEGLFRASVYMVAVCRCFPGKGSGGGDRAPSSSEIGNCSSWLEREIEILRPELVLAVGRLAINRFISCKKLDDVIGRIQRVLHEPTGVSFDLIPLPHPSGVSRWHQAEPGRSLLNQALQLMSQHPAFCQAIAKPALRRNC